jgi:hypothetical protein
MDQAEKLRTTQKKQLENQLMENSSNAFYQSVAASGDTYIASALRKVRESNVTHPEFLTRISGSWMHNQMLNSSQEKK